MDFAFARKRRWSLSPLKETGNKDFVWGSGIRWSLFILC